MAKSRILSSIDIGSSKITTIISKSDDNSPPSIIGVSSLPSKGVRKGQIVNIEEATQSIIESVEAAERMAGLNISSAYVSINGAHISSQNSTGVVAVSQPQGEISQEDIFRVIDAAQAISLPTGKQIIHILPTNFKVDSQEGVKDPVGMTGIRLETETHIVLGSDTAIKNLNKCVQEIGISSDDLVFSGLASAYSTLSETEKELGVVLVDIGGGTTSIAIFVEGALNHSAVIPIGAKNITNDLAIGLRVSLETAEKIKLHLSKNATEKSKTPTSSAERKKADLLDVSSLGIKEDLKEISKKTLIDGIIKPRLDEILTMVGLEIKKSGLAHLVPSGLVVTGGGALSHNLIPIAKRNLSVPVRIGNPQGVTGLIDDINTPEYAGAIGLTIYGTRSIIEPSSPFSGISQSIPQVKLGGIAGKISGVLKSLLP
jgi:cell division protein FtsA